MSWEHDCFICPAALRAHSLSHPSTHLSATPLQAALGGNTWGPVSVPASSRVCAGDALFLQPVHGAGLHLTQHNSSEATTSAVVTEPEQRDGLQLPSMDPEPTHLRAGMKRVLMVL